MINFIASNDRFMPHLHIPLQSGSDRILKKMKRRYNVETYIDKINKIKDKIHDCTIGVDIMAGFPGETEKDFSDSYDLLSQLPIAYLHVFPFSERENTAADSMKNKVSLDVRYARAKILRKLSNMKFKEIQNRNINQVKSVLFELSEDGFLSGLTDNYIRVKVAEPNQSKTNFISDVKLIEVNDGVMLGEMV